MTKTQSSHAGMLFSRNWDAMAINLSGSHWVDVSYIATYIIYLNWDWIGLFAHLSRLSGKFCVKIPAAQKVFLWLCLVEAKTTTVETVFGVQRYLYITKICVFISRWLDTQVVCTIVLLLHMVYCSCEGWTLNSWPPYRAQAGPGETDAMASRCCR